jgi:hypothetical protein
LEQAEESSRPIKILRPVVLLSLYLNLIQGIQVVSVLVVNQSKPQNPVASEHCPETTVVVALVVETTAVVP